MNEKQSKPMCWFRPGQVYRYADGTEVVIDGLWCRGTGDGFEIVALDIRRAGGKAVKQYPVEVIEKLIKDDKLKKITL